MDHEHISELLLEIIQFYDGVAKIQVFEFERYLFTLDLSIFMLSVIFTLVVELPILLMKIFSILAFTLKSSGGHRAACFEVYYGCATSCASGKLFGTVTSVSQQKGRIQAIILSMSNSYRKLLTSQSLPGRPTVCYDSLRRALVHVYEGVPLETANFQTEVNYYLGRKESYSGNVVVVSKIKDEQITYNMGKPAMEVSVVTDYVPWRLGVEPGTLNKHQALFLLDGACRGFRQLLHRVRFPFLVQAGMIGVDGVGDVRVWWNDLFYRSNFGFTMGPNYKLREMVKSLVDVVCGRMEKGESEALQGELVSGEATFVTLEEKIKQLSKGINLKQIGKTLLSNKEEYLIAMRESGLAAPLRNSAVVVEPLRLSGVVARTGLSPTTQRVIMTPRRQGQLQFNKKLITKRTYRDGTSPTFHQKIQIIKEDIENLRSFVNKNPQPQPQPVLSHSQIKVRSSKSVESIFSYRKGLSGDINIPEVSKIIKESQVIGPTEDLTISRFVEPIAQSTTSINAQHCAVCNNLQELRKSQLSGEKGQSDPMFLSRLQSLVGQDKSINSTSRSMNESRLQKNASSENLIPKFGESEKKLPGNVYFTSLFEA